MVNNHYIFVVTIELFDPLAPAKETHLGNIHGVLVLLVLLLCSLIYRDAVSKHKPYAVCDLKAAQGASTEEVRQCRHSVEFAMHAGW